MYNVYNIEITILNIQTYTTHKENVKFCSRWAARQMARKYADCMDVTNVEVVDTETGELILHLNADGKVIWDTEG